MVIFESIISAVMITKFLAISFVALIILGICEFSNDVEFIGEE